MHEQIHIAAWPGMPLYQPHVHAFSSDAQLIATQMYAMEGQTFVLCAIQLVGKKAHEFFCTNETHEALIGYGGGFATIFGPDGRELAERLPPDAEGILYAEIDLAEIAMAKQAAAPVGHYSRPDVFSLQFNNQSLTPINQLRDLNRQRRAGALESVSEQKVAAVTLDASAPDLQIQDSDGSALVVEKTQRNEAGC